MHSRRSSRGGRRERMAASLRRARRAPFQRSSPSRSTTPRSSTAVSASSPRLLL